MSCSEIFFVDDVVIAVCRGLIVDVGSFANRIFCRICCRFPFVVAGDLSKRLDTSSAVSQG